MTLSSNEWKYNAKILLNITELLQINRIKSVVLMFEATLDCYQRGHEPSNQKQMYLHTLENVFKDVSYVDDGSSSKISIKSMAQEFNAAFCDPDVDPCIVETTTSTSNQLEHVSMFETHVVSTM